MHDRPCFVQFIHPGGEHQPDDGDRRAWTQGKHGRKFMKAPGRYVTTECVREGDLTFWGEWEPESRVLRRYQTVADDTPRFLHEPYFVRPADLDRHQNTDPFVFGDRFHYTGCQQYMKRWPTQLRHLAPGSIVLFGSCRAKSRFVLDTVFVVADHVDHDRSDYETVLEGRVADTYRAVTIDPWYAGKPQPAQSYRLYFGATLDEPVGRMHSFFPCLPDDDTQAGFARPEISLPDFVSPGLFMGKKIARDLSVPKLEQLWDEVVGQVRAQGLVLGVHAELPRDETGRPAQSAAA